MTLPGIEPLSSGPLANTLLIRPMLHIYCVCIFVYMCSYLQNKAYIWHKVTRVGVEKDIYLVQELNLRL